MDGEFPAAITSDEQERETIKRSRLASILNRHESPGLMHHEVRNSHFAAANEGCKARDHTQKNQQPTAEFDDASRQHQRRMQGLMSTESPKQLLGSMAHKQKADHNSERCIRYWFQVTEKFHLSFPFGFSEMAAEFKRQRRLCR